MKSLDWRWMWPWRWRWTFPRTPHDTCWECAFHRMARNSQVKNNIKNSFPAHAAVTHNWNNKSRDKQICRHNCKTTFRWLKAPRQIDYLNCPLSGSTFRFQLEQLMPLWQMIRLCGCNSNRLQTKHITSVRCIKRKRQPAAERWKLIQGTWELRSS